MTRDQLRIATAVLLTLLLVGVLAGCGNPEVGVRDLEGAYGSNTVTKITIDPDAPCPRATYAQELYEARAKRNPVVGIGKRFDSSIHRQMEVEGHEVETQAAVRFCGAHEHTYRQSEAEVMQNGYGGLFRDMSIIEIEARMQEFTEEANKWINAHRVSLSKLRIED